MTSVIVHHLIAMLLLARWQQDLLDYLHYKNRDIVKINNNDEQWLMLLFIIQLLCDTGKPCRKELREVSPVLIK